MFDGGVAALLRVDYYDMAAMRASAKS